MDDLDLTGHSLRRIARMVVADDRLWQLVAEVIDHTGAEGAANFIRAIERVDTPEAHELYEWLIWRYSGG